MEHVGSFVARDGAGNEYTIEVWQRYTTSRRTLSGGGGKKIPTQKELRCAEGDVNKVGERRYEIITRTGGKIDLTSDDPNAD